MLETLPEDEMFDLNQLVSMQSLVDVFDKSHAIPFLWQIGNSIDRLDNELK